MSLPSSSTFVHHEGDPDYKNVSGVLVPAMFQEQSVNDTMNFEPRPDDVIITTYPKCGTTWMQYIVSLILRKGEPFSGAEDFFRRTPFFEMCGLKAVEDMPKPGAFKIHMPRQLVKHWSTEAKYIYVARNPKDCCVSLFHHTRMFPGYLFQEGSFDRFFELFMKGHVEFNDYFDHLMGWYEKINEPNLLFITYESLKADKEGIIMKVAKFLGDEYAESIQNDPQVLKNILYYSSFDFMQQQTNEIWGVFINPEEADSKGKNLPEGVSSVAGKGHRSAKKSSFIRKGVVGDYKNLMKDEQVKRLEEKFQEKCKGSDLLNLWKDI